MVSKRFDPRNLIVLARIKEVRVGVDDLDPTVGRKGIKYAVRP